jgi:multiple sugar transport system substrate-binding protein
MNGRDLSKNETMSCRRVATLASRFLDDGLMPEEAARVQTHLDSCQTCRWALERESAIANRLQLDAARERRRLSPAAAARVQKGVYQRIRRRMMVQKASRMAWAVVGLLLLALVVTGLYSFWHWRGGNDVFTTTNDEVVTITFACRDHERSQFLDLVDDFQRANPDVRVQFISADEASGQQKEGATITSDGGEIGRLSTAADTFHWYARPAPSDWAYLLELDTFVDDPSFPTDDYFPGTLEHFRWQGNMHGLPSMILPILIFYDRTFFEEAGISTPEIGWDWGVFENTAAQLTVREDGEVSRYGFVDSYPYFTILAVMQQHDVPLWDRRSDPPQALFDTPEVAQVVRRYTDMASTYEIMPKPEIGSNVMAFNLINDGKVAMWTDFGSGIDVIRARPGMGVVPFPEEVTAANPRSIYGFFASAGTQHPEAAWRWLAFLSANYEPFLEGTMPGRRSVAERLRWWRRLDRETREVFEHVLAYPVLDDSPLNLPLWLAVASVFRDGTSIEEALANSQRQAIEMQADLATASVSTPQIVATPKPEPALAEGDVIITFSPKSRGELSLYRDLAESFLESHPTIWVEIVPADFAEAARVSDCFAGPPLVHLEGMREQLANLQPLLEADQNLSIADFYPQFLTPLQLDGDLWGLPYEADALMLYYNTGRFTEAEISLPELDWSIDDFLSVAGDLSGGDRYGFTTREGAYGDLILILERMGGRLVDDSAESPTPSFDDPAVQASMERYADLYREHALSPGTPSRQSGWPDSMVTGFHPAGVNDGRVAMWIDTMSNHTLAPSLPFDTGVAPLPVGVTESTEFDLAAYYISASSSDPQACWDWVTYLSGRPEVVELLPARRSVASSSLWQGQTIESALPAYQATLEYDATSLFQLRWEIPWLGYSYPWLYEAFQAIVGGEGAEQVLGEALARAEELVACLEMRQGYKDSEHLLACAQQVDPDYPVTEGGR